MQDKDKSRRSYGSGSLIEKTDKGGRASWYGKWRENNRQVMRRLGVKRAPGSRDGLTRAQAEAELRRLMREVRATPAVGDRVTLREVGARYLEDIERRGRKRATVVGLESALRVRLLPVLGDKTLDRIRPEDVADLLAIMEADGLSDKSIRNYIGTLSAIFNYAQRKGLAHDNPVSRVELPQRAQYAQEIRFLEPEEVQALAVAAVPGAYQDVDRALYVTAAMTGLRQGELIALRWMDVDWPAGRVRVRRNYVLGEFGTPKSRRSERSVPMADEVGGALARLSRAHGDPAPGALVFPDPHTGGPLNNAAVLRRFRHAWRPPTWTPLTDSTTSDTHLGLAAPPRAFRCARCRSGWGTGTSRRRSGTRTTRLRTTRRR